ncbi:MAG: hypothetical protein KC766_23260 [Myxococcales bacterium]|nr:hypothetical protein [Myxococcales bacterium]
MSLRWLPSRRGALVDCDAPTPQQSPAIRPLAHRGPRLLPPYDGDTQEQPALSLPPSTERMDPPLPASQPAVPTTVRPPPLPGPRKQPKNGVTTLALGSPPEGAATPRGERAPVSAPAPPTRPTTPDPVDLRRKTSVPEAQSEGPPPAQRRPRPELSQRIMLFAEGSSAKKAARKIKPRRARAPLGWIVFGIAGFTFGCLSLAALAGTIAGGRLAQDRAAQAPAPSASPISLEARIESCAGCMQPATLPALAPSAPTVPSRPRQPRHVSSSPAPAASSSALPGGLPGAGL